MLEDFKAFWVSELLVDGKALATQVRVPTLIVQTRDDQMNSLARGKKLADLVPGGGFVVVEGADHIPMPGTPRSQQIPGIVVPFLLLDQDLPNKAATSTVPP